jgi:hypothetical protein
MLIGLALPDPACLFLSQRVVPFPLCALPFPCLSCRYRLYRHSLVTFPSLVFLSSLFCSLRCHFLFSCIPPWCFHCCYFPPFCIRFPSYLYFVFRCLVLCRSQPSPGLPSPSCSPDVIVFLASLSCLLALRMFFVLQFVSCFLRFFFTPISFLSSLSVRFLPFLGCVSCL